MCYKYPGPRCSAHARQSLRKAQVAYQQDATYDNYVAVREAEKNFDITPAGQDRLREMMEREEDFEKRYLLQQRLERGIEARQEALRAINAKDQGDIQQETHDGTATKTPTNPLPDTKLREPYALGNCSYMGGIDTDYDSYECSDSDCDGYYCSDKKYYGLRIERVDEREFLASCYGVDKDQVPDEFVQRLKEEGLRNHVEVDVDHGYYGEEMRVTVSKEVQDLVSKMYYSQPNAVDRDRSLQYSRQEGVDTTDMRPLEALKASVDTSNLDDDIKHRVTTARESKRSKVRLSEIHYNAAELEDVTGYDFSQVKATSTNIDGGLLVRTADARYYLVGGKERFKAVQEKGNAFWKFQILERPLLKAPERAAGTRANGARRAAPRRRGNGAV